jgi:hypothetical protein
VCRNIDSKVQSCGARVEPSTLVVVAIERGRTDSMACPRVRKSRYVTCSQCHRSMYLTRRIRCSFGLLRGVSISGNLSAVCLWLRRNCSERLSIIPKPAISRRTGRPYSFHPIRQLSYLAVWFRLHHWERPRILRKIDAEPCRASLASEVIPSC